MQNVDREREALKIFMAICALDEPDRAAAVHSRCNGDDALRQRVEQMLRADAAATGPIATDAKVDEFIADQVRQIAPEATYEVRSPVAEGHYTILRVIGEGGMGTVYEAQQHQPSRRVAIKAIRAGRITPQMRKRFDYEAQVLGRLEHPGIARLYESDTQADAGKVRAFLAMELVIGEPIDVYVNLHRLDINDRVRLFMKVCEAVAYAHRMGIIHRDLKPANILVNAEGQPKVLDFGVARVVDTSENLVTTMLTQHGQIIGTLAYMSPEQVEGLGDVDTRTDVYSLGVILFKLLTGMLPIDLDDASLASATDKLLNEEPRRIGQIDRRLKGDLEMITARSLEKDPSRRYASVEALHAELDRYLTGRPIEARGDSALYIIRKAVWRHRTLVGVGCLSLGLLVAFGVYASFSAERNRRLAIVAESARDTAIESEGRAAMQADRLRHSLYFSSIGFAQSALENNDIARVRALLDACDLSLRQWEWHYLRRLCDLSAETITLHMERPRYAIFSADRKFAAYASLNREVMLVDKTTGTERLRETLPEGTARAVVSANGSYLAFGSVVNDITLVDLQTDQRRSLSFMPTDTPADNSYRSLRVVGFTEDAATLITGGLDNKLRLWNTDDGSMRKVIDLAPTGLPICMMVLNGRAIVGDHRGGLQAYDLETGAIVQNYPGHDAAVWSLALGPDGRSLASGDNDARVIVRDLQTGTITTQIDTNDGWITSLAFNPDGTMLAEGRADSTIRLLHLPEASSSGVLRGHRHAVVNVAFDPDGTIRSTSIDGYAKVWRPRSALGVPTIEVGEAQTIGLAFTADGTALLAGSGDGQVRQWALAKVADRSVPEELHSLPSHPESVLEIAIDPVNGLACTTSRDGTAHLVDLKDGKLVRPLAGISGTLPAAAFSRDGRYVAVGSSKRLALFEVKTGTLVRDFDTEGSIANEVRFDRAGQKVYAACSDGVLRRWSLDGTSAGAVTVDSSGAYEFAFHPDGSSVVVTGDNGNVLMLDITTLLTIRKFVGHQGTVTDVAFHPDGQRLATCGYDRTIRIWDVESATELLTLRGHRRVVNQIAFSPDGSLLASTSDDGTVRIWPGKIDKPPHQ